MISDNTRQILRREFDRAHLLPLALLPLISFFSDRVAPILVGVTLVLTLAYRIRVGLKPLVVTKINTQLLLLLALVYGSMLVISVLADNTASSLGFMLKISTIALPALLLALNTNVDELQSIFWYFCISILIAVCLIAAKQAGWFDGAALVSFIQKLNPDWLTAPVNRSVLIVAVCASVPLLWIAVLFETVNKTAKITAAVVAVAVLALVQWSPGHAPWVYLLVLVVTALLFRLSPKWTTLVVAATAGLAITLMPIVVALFEYYAWPIYSLLPVSLTSEFSDSGRMEIWSNALKAISAQPWLGYGLGNNFIAPLLKTHPHNAALQMWLNGGVVGACLFGLVFASGAFLLGQLQRKIAGVLLPVFAGLFAVSMMSHGAWQSWWLALGLVVLTPNLIFVGEQAKLLRLRQDNAMFSSLVSAKLMAAFFVVMIFTSALTLYTIHTTNAFSTNKTTTFDFRQWPANFAADPRSRYQVLNQPGSLKTVEKDGRVFLETSGYAVLFARERIAINPQHQYRMCVRLNAVATTAAPVEVAVFAGFATYDAAGKLQDAPPGAHRYGTLKRSIFSVDGWQTYCGVFHGQGNLNDNMFREGTAKASPLVLMNMSNLKDVRVQVEWIRIESNDG